MSGLTEDLAAWWDGIGVRIMGKQILGVKHRQRHSRLFLSLCPGSGSPPLHFVFQLLLVLFAKGEDKRKRSSIFF